MVLCLCALCARSPTRQATMPDLQVSVFNVAGGDPFRSMDAVLTPVEENAAYFVSGILLLAPLPKSTSLRCQTMVLGGALSVQEHATTPNGLAGCRRFTTLHFSRISRNAPDRVVFTTRVPSVPSQARLPNLLSVFVFGSSWLPSSGPERMSGSGVLPLPGESLFSDESSTSERYMSADDMVQWRLSLGEVFFGN